MSAASRGALIKAGAQKQLVFSVGGLAGLTAKYPFRVVGSARAGKLQKHVSS